MILNKINIKKHAAVLLGFYIFFLLLASFHSHNIIFQTFANVQPGQIDTTNTSIENILDEDSVCQLCLFNNTKIIIDNNFDLELLLTKISENIHTDYSNHYLARHFFNFDLRAPPLNS